MDYNDNELLFMVNEDAESARRILIDKYTPIINIIVHKYISYAFSCGLDEKDLFQEGVIGLIHAIETYQENKNVLFYTYACVCVSSNIKSALRTASRKKNIVLNNSVSLDKVINEEDEINLYDILEDLNSDPMEKIIIKEKSNEIKKYLENELTEFERKVFELKLRNFSNKEISEILNKDKKSIENTFQRIKLKYKNYIEVNSI